MKARPWPIVILALLHILAPVANAIFCAELSHQSVWEFTSTMAKQDGAWGIIDFFVLLPVAGIAIYMCKPWSYPIFLAITLETIYVNFMTWKNAPAIFTFPMLSVTGFLDLAFVGYFLLPSVRKTYLDASVRWWEAKPRYQVEVDADLSTGEGRSVAGQIVDISEGGAFVQSSAVFDANSTLLLQFQILGQKFQIASRVVYQRKAAPQGYGLRFEPATRRERIKFRRLAHALFLMGVRPRHEHDSLASFVDWTKGLLTEGRGLFPEAGHRAPPKSNVISIEGARDRKRSDSDAA